MQVIDIAKCIATGFGSGLAPKAPGTFGTIGIFVLTLPLPYFVSATDLLAFLIPLIFALYLIGIWSINQVSPEWGNDPGKIVIDEWVGYLITIVFSPINLTNLVIGFLLFRFFDIVKPLGIKYFDNIKSAHGVMLDDVLAGIYSALTLYLIQHFL